MAIPDDVKEAAIGQVATFCATRVPADVADEIRVEYELRGNKITIYERRPPWREDLGPGWTSMRICVFEWDATDSGGRSTSLTATIVAAGTSSPSQHRT